MNRAVINFTRDELGAISSSVDLSNPGYSQLGVKINAGLATNTCVCDVLLSQDEMEYLLDEIGITDNSVLREVFNKITNVVTGFVAKGI